MSDPGAAAVMLLGFAFVVGLVIGVMIEKIRKSED